MELESYSLESSEVRFICLFVHLAIILDTVMRALRQFPRCAEPSESPRSCHIHSHQESPWMETLRLLVWMIDVRFFSVLEQLVIYRHLSNPQFLYVKCT